MAEMKVMTLDAFQYFVQQKLDPIVDGKVDKVTGKALSTNDFTNAYKETVDSLKTTVDGLTATGGQANVIETVKVNGTALTPDASKAVNIDLSGYATKSDVSAIPKFAVSVVDELPTENISGTTIYLVPNSGSGTNAHDEFIYAGGAWELLGTTQVDISGKADKSYVDTELAKLVPQTRKVAGKALSADITLAKGDVGLGNVDNTSDLDKPISTATQTALDAKLNSADLVAITNAEIDALFTSA